MMGPAITVGELTEALEAAGVGLYLYEGARGVQRWLAGEARYGDPVGAETRARLAETVAPGEVAQVGEAGVDERLVRLADDGEGRPRFFGVLRAAEHGAGAALAVRNGRPGLQAHLTDLAEALPTETTVVCAAFAVDGLREFCRAYGYDAGDALARAVGRRVARALPAEAAFARIGGAKFAAVIVGDDGDAFRARAEAVCGEVNASPFDVGFGPVSVTISVGAAIARAAALATPEPFDAALAALDEARGDGEAGLFVAEHDADASPLSPAAMRAGARAVMRALEQDRVAIAFQPVVSAGSPTRVAFRECLARVLDDEGRWLPAGLFLPKIERLDLVRALDRRVLRLALDALAAHPTERLSVNVSVRTMHDRAWLRTLETAFAADPSAVERLIVELTESAAVVEPERTKAFLDAVRAMGVAIALDDFGAGYSSFRHVRDFRPDWVKIDGGFVRGVATDADNKLFVDTLVGIARNFDMATVAEFVETHEDAAALRALGVDCLQGYLYGKPAIEPDWDLAAAAAVGEA
ncbi:MAG: GGDEF domain-containing protein [Rhodobacteraceae bacterium]|nr:MAG: GGDEF domain-containing protein [Paracoccaceae bacterium]